MKLFRMKIWALSGLWAILAVSAIADVDNSKVGTRGYSFLKIELAARPVAMGGAFTGVADDEASLFYNPAGTVGFEDKRFLFGYHDNIFDMQSGFVGYIHPLNYRGDKSLSLYLQYLSYGDFVRTNSLGEEEGTFSGSDVLFGAGYAMMLNEDFKIGGTLKIIYEKIDAYSSHGFALDLGVRQSLDRGRTVIGLAAQNLGAQLSGFTESGEKDPLPLRFRGGVSTIPQGLPLLLAGDIVYPTDNDMYFCLGAEILEIKPLFIRLGWSSFGSNYKTNSGNDDWAGFSGGFGVEYRKMQISYAISPQADLGTSHRITFSGGF